jgi:hypothetical protein
LGTGAMGIGADVRHASLKRRAGTLAGRTTATPSTAAVMVVTNEGLDWLECWPSDDAQQLSACTCVRTRADPERCESPLCIGHSPPSAQQAMRASGLGIHPAHIAAFPASRPNVSARTARRWTSLTTCLGCWSAARVSNAGRQRERSYQVKSAARRRRPLSFSAHRIRGLQTRTLLLDGYSTPGRDCASG